MEAVVAILGALGLAGGIFAWYKAIRREAKREAVQAQQDQARKVLARLEEIDTEANKEEAERIEASKRKLRAVVSRDWKNSEELRAVFDALVREGEQLRNRLLK